VKPPSAAFLDKARSMLEHARVMVTVDLYEDAGRTAYLAGYHAAQAFIFEREDKVIKTHRGVQGEFARLSKAEGRFDTDLRPFLGRAYQLKSIADYETGPSAQVTLAQASQAIETAQRFIETIALLIG
jgi:uncharacterized protein (UPF0332 family)